MQKNYESWKDEIAIVSKESPRERVYLKNRYNFYERAKNYIPPGYKIKRI